MILLIFLGQMFPDVYLGHVSHAENKSLLQRMRITHVLNCAGIPSIRYQREERLDTGKGWGLFSQVMTECRKN